MDNVHFLNLEYIFLRLYEVVTGIHVDVGSVPSETVFWLGQFALLGLSLAVILLGFLVYVAVKLTIVEHEGFHHRAHEEAEKSIEEGEVSSLNPRWDLIMTLASSGNESDWRRAILEADIMLGELLSDKGYRGESIGEQLKDVNPLQFNTLDLAWKAHKMRNAIAHLGEAFPLSQRDTQATIDQYARVFEEFGII